MSPNWSLGRTGQLYAIEESAYDTSTTLSATNALRHLNFSAHYDPKSLTKSPERHTHPSLLAMLTRRAQASFGIKGQLYPSGTLNTLPEADLLLKNSFGAAASNITLATTFSGTPTTTTGTVASATGLAVGQFVQINIASGGSAGTYLRFLTGVSGANLTWSPALPAAPVSGDTCKGAITYGLGSTIPKSLDICHYPQSPSTWYNREILGAVIEKLSLMFDSNLEPMFDVSGPACEMVSAQSQPVSFTTVGAESGIPSGLTGAFLWGATSYQIEKLQFDLQNAMLLQNSAFGSSKATGYLRKNKRAVTVKVNAKVSDSLTLWTPSLTPSSGTLFLQVGTTAAKMWALYLPVAQLMNPPDTPDAEETNNWDFALTALGTSGNDEAYLGMA